MVMKKLAVIMSILALTGLSRAAEFRWEVDGQLRDYGGALDDGDGWALAGARMGLIYNGISGSFDPSSFGWDLNVNDWVVGAGSQIVAWYSTTASDYAAGTLGRQTINDVGLDWLGDVSADWNAMNNRVFTLVGISNVGGDYTDGQTTWNHYTANASGFSELTGNDSVGNLRTSIFNISGAGAINVIPEPATFLLMAMGGVGAWLLRRKNRLMSEE